MSAPTSESRSCGEAQPIAVAGLIPFSATDWPGMLTATVFTQGCPWRCRYCHNPELKPFLRAGEPAGSWAEAMALLRRRRGLLDGLVISGGEPTAQPGLGRAVAEVHAVGFPVGVHTCGYAPRRLERLLSDPASRPDWIGIDVKALPADLPDVVGRPEGVARAAWASLAIVARSGVPAQARTTVWPGSVLERHLPRLRERVAKLGLELVVQRARGVDAEGWYRGDSGSSPGVPDSGADLNVEEA